MLLQKWLRVGEISCSTSRSSTSGKGSRTPFGAPSFCQGWRGLIHELQPEHLEFATWQVFCKGWHVTFSRNLILKHIKTCCIPKLVVVFVGVFISETLYLLCFVWWSSSQQFLEPSQPGKWRKAPPVVRWDPSLWPGRLTSPWGPHNDKTSVGTGVYIYICYPPPWRVYRFHVVVELKDNLVTTRIFVWM